MAKCKACGSTILVGGVRDGEARYCNEKCHGQGHLLETAAGIPEDLVRRQAMAIHAGACPKCGGSGPVDIHESFQIWSAFLITSWTTNRLTGCRRCGTRAKLTDLAASCLVGWWGIPWGIIMTPVQIARNISSLVRRQDPYSPSPKLARAVRLSLAADLLSQQQEREAG